MRDAPRLTKCFLFVQIANIPCRKGDGAARAGRPGPDLVAVPKSRGALLRGFGCVALIVAYLHLMH